MSSMISSNIQQVRYPTTIECSQKNKSSNSNHLERIGEDVLRETLHYLLINEIATLSLSSKNINKTAKKFLYSMKEKEAKLSCSHQYVFIHGKLQKKLFAMEDRSFKIDSFIKQIQLRSIKQKIPNKEGAKISNSPYFVIKSGCIEISDSSYLEKGIRWYNQHFQRLEIRSKAAKHQPFPLNLNNITPLVNISGYIDTTVLYVVRCDKIECIRNLTLQTGFIDIRENKKLEEIQGYINCKGNTYICNNEKLKKLSITGKTKNIYIKSCPKLNDFPKLYIRGNVTLIDVTKNLLSSCEDRKQDGFIEGKINVRGKISLLRTSEREH